MTALQCVGEMVIYAHEPQHAAKIHRSVTTYSVQNSISDTLIEWPNTLGLGSGNEVG